MDFYAEMHEAFDRMLRENRWEAETVLVKARTLTPEEVMGNPEHQDYPLVKGRERMMEVVFRGCRGQAFTDMYGDYEGTLAEICAMPLTNNYRRAVFLATLNAVAGCLGRVDRTIHCRDDRPPVCARDLVRHLSEHYGRPRVALVGLQPRMAEALSGAFELRITDMDADNIGKDRFGTRIEGPDAAAAHLAWCDLALVTGTTLSNATFEDFLKADKPVLFYGVTVAAPAHILNLKRFCPYGT